MWEFQCGRCPHFQKDREKHKDAWVGSLKAADFTMDMLISLVMLDEWTILFDPIWSIYLGLQKLGSPEIHLFSIFGRWTPASWGADTSLKLCPIFDRVPTSSTPAWSVPCPIAYIRIIRIPRSTTAAKTTPIKWGEAAGISSCGPSLREVGSFCPCFFFWLKNWDNKFIHPWSMTQKLSADFINSIKFHGFLVWCFFLPPWGNMSATKLTEECKSHPPAGGWKLLIPFPQLRCGCQNESHGNVLGGFHWEMVACKLII